MPMQHTTQNGGEGPARLVKGLGWLSIGLGLTQLTAPRRLARFIGLPHPSGNRALMRALGARELAAGLGILTRPRPGFLWARVAGDLMDLALLGSAFRSECARTERLTAAIAAVAGVTVLDLLGGRRMSRDSAHRRLKGGQALEITEAITINRPLDDVQAVPLTADGAVSYVPAPGGRGTEVRVTVGRKSARSKVKQELRRYKQLLELGEVVR